MENIGKKKKAFITDAFVTFITNFDAEFLLIVFAGLLGDNCLWECELHLRGFTNKSILHGLALCVRVIYCICCPLNLMSLSTSVNIR